MGTLISNGLLGNLVHTRWCKISSIHSRLGSKAATVIDIVVSDEPVPSSKFFANDDEYFCFRYLFYISL